MTGYSKWEALRQELIQLGIALATFAITGAGIYWSTRH